MRRVFKYKISDVEDYTIIKIPFNSVLLSVDTQGDELFLWASVEDSESKTVLRTIRVAGTGHPINDTILGFLGTVKQQNDSLVWHIFEVTND